MANNGNGIGNPDLKALVSRYLDAHQSAAFRLNVVGTRQDGDYHYVVVQPDREGIASYDYYNILAEVENEIENRENLNVLLVPTLPGG